MTNLQKYIKRELDVLMQERLNLVNRIQKLSESGAYTSASAIPDVIFSSIYRFGYIAKYPDRVKSDLIRTGRMIEAFYELSHIDYEIHEKFREYIKAYEDAKPQKKSKRLKTNVKN